jgi:RNA recognition motif-containing protein
VQEKVRFSVNIVDQQSKMSDVDMSSDEEMKKIVKKEKKEKKTKKDKKEKKEKKSSKPKVEAESNSDNEATETPAKKRKREILPDEIVVDIALPEPASKKAARAAKKAKLNPKPATTEASGEATTDGANGEAKKTAEEKRSEFGVWIGNLPWSATKDSLRSFIMENTEIKTEQITRVHMPPSTKPVPAHWTTKPNNKGFAYVDFSTELAMYAAIAMTETKMDGRALLIKNAKSFEGRPDKPKAEVEEVGGRGAKVAGKTGGHPPNKRVFVGNLSFDVTKEDLEAHYAPCGPVENIHMATFEDSGKCKGYAWVTFGDVETATCAVQGFVMKTEAEVKAMKKKADGSDDETEIKNPTKRRKWLLNKLNGRDMRCEFAEDSTTRYNKRYGKDKPAAPVDGVNPDRWKNFGGDNERPRREPREPRAPRPPKNGPNSVEPGKKVDPRSIKSGSAHMNAQRASQAIVEGKGKKTTFE